MRRDPDNILGRYILGPDKDLMPCPDLLTWGKWMEENERHVADDTVGDIWVSTVFLGLDHQFYNGPPMLFETMTFRIKNGKHDMSGMEQFRYSTWDDAWAGHAALVKRLRKKLGPAEASNSRGDTSRAETTDEA